LSARGARASVDDHIFKKILWLLHQLGIETDRPGAVIASAPLRLNPLDEAAPDVDALLPFPLDDQPRQFLAKQLSLPLTQDISSSASAC
jgi:hypothetical protein